MWLKKKKKKFTLQHIIKEKTVKYEIEINHSKKLYSNKEYDITIIEIKEKDNIKINSESFLN